MGTCDMGGLCCKQSPCAYLRAAPPDDDGSGIDWPTVGPRLLEALEEVMGWIDNWDPNFAMDDEWPDTRNKARAAIAAAKGDAE